MRAHGRMLRTTIVLVAAAVALAAPTVSAKGPGGGSGGGGGGGGHETVAGNNLSFPVIWSDGVTKALRGTYGAPVLDGAYTVVDGVAWYEQQQLLNTWQAESASALGTGVLDIDWVDWGDNLARTWYLTSQVRIETVLLQDLAVPMTGYQVRYLYGTGANEMWGTNGLTYESSQATVYTGCARLTIQKLLDGATDLTWDAAAGRWTGDVGKTIFNGGTWQAGDGPGYYSAEINVPGKVIYGYNWNVTRANDGAGLYRITFSLDEVNCTYALNADFGTTRIVPKAEVESTFVQPLASEPVPNLEIIDLDLNLTYVDLPIAGRGN